MCISFKIRFQLLHLAPLWPLLWRSVSWCHPQENQSVWWPCFYEISRIWSNRLQYYIRGEKHRQEVVFDLFHLNGETDTSWLLTVHCLECFALYMLGPRCACCVEHEAVGADSPFSSSFPVWFILIPLLLSIHSCWQWLVTVEHWVCCLRSVVAGLMFLAAACTPLIITCCTSSQSLRVSVTWTCVKPWQAKPAVNLSLCAWFLPNTKASWRRCRASSSQIVSSLLKRGNSSGMLALKASGTRKCRKDDCVCYTAYESKIHLWRQVFAFGETHFCIRNTLIMFPVLPTKFHDLKVRQF